MPIETKYKVFDPLLAQQYAQKTFSTLVDEDDVAERYTYVKNESLQFTVVTNNDPHASKPTYVLPMYIDNEFHTYTFTTQPSGTTLEKIIISLPFPATVETNEVRIHQATL